MEQKIKLISGNETKGQCEILNKLKAEQRILELFETEQIEKVDITYKERIERKITQEADYISVEVTSKNPVDKNSTGMRAIQNKDCIILQKL